MIIKAFKFGLSGIMVTGLHVVVAFVLITTVLPIPAAANGIAFVVANLFSYAVNTLWTFSSPLQGRSLLRFVLVSLLGFIIAVTVSGLAEWYGLHYWYGIALVVCCVTPVTFLLHNFWTYRQDATG
jgi:putative flippase GtrA